MPNFKKVLFGLFVFYSRFMNYAIVFPGQGSQSKSMLADVAEKYPIVVDIFARASEVLGFDLWQLTQHDGAALNKTQNTQVAMLSAGYAVYKVLTSKYKLQAKYLAGHSLGEYTALVVGNYLEFEDAVILVRKRAELMQLATPDGVGAMAAIIGLEDDKVIKLCKEITQGVVEAVNFNSPEQVVIAGNKESVILACDIAKNYGAKRAILLPVSVPSHCKLMQGAATKFAKIINNTNMKMGNTAVIHNVNASIATNIIEVKNNLIKQLYNSVKWTQTVQYMSKNGTSLLLECGANKVLTGLTKRIDKNLSAIAVCDNNSIKTAYEVLKNEG